MHGRMQTLVGKEQVWTVLRIRLKSSNAQLRIESKRCEPGEMLEARTPVLPTGPVGCSTLQEQILPQALQRLEQDVVSDGSVQDLVLS